MFPRHVLGLIFSRFGIHFWNQFPYTIFLRCNFRLPIYQIRSVQKPFLLLLRSLVSHLPTCESGAQTQGPSSHSRIFVRAVIFFLQLLSIVHACSFPVLFQLSSKLPSHGKASACTVPLPSRFHINVPLAAPPSVVPDGVGGMRRSL